MSLIWADEFFGTRNLDEAGITLPAIPTVYVSTCLGAANWVCK
jgi:hypothetical protein